MKFARFASLMICIAITPALSKAAMADRAVSVKDLDWISGAWVGQLGDRVLEETWSEPQAGTMAAHVRMTSDGKTVMVELLFIREENGTLALHVEPWNPELQPGMPGFQKLVLAKLDHNSARFVGSVPGEGFRSLTYRRPSADRFRIEVETQEGAFSVNLSPRGAAAP